VARALRVIANQRSDYALQKAASSMESGTSDFMLDIGEAYNRLQITARNASDDMVFNYYTSLSNGAAAGSKDSFTQALRTIAHDRQSAFLLRKLDDPNADVQAEPGTADQPVGLDNIGNTCYLNSLLQYFYTIKPVRDVVMNIEEYRMALTEDDLKKKRAGGRLVTKAEVIKGQRCRLN
jgi:ubiquitin carboxyl-terminal hydrolase 25